MDSYLYRFGPFVLDTRRRVLRRADQPIPLAPKALEVLAVLVGRAGTIVEKGELLDTVWSGTAVEENNLTVQIAALRRALGDSPDARRYIVTIPGRGYSFVAEVTDEQPANAAPAVSVQQADATADRSNTRRRRAVMMAALAGIAVFTCLAWLWLARPRASRITMTQVTTNSTELPVWAAALSPDGKLLAYADAAGVHVRISAAGRTEEIGAARGLEVHGVSWFPDNATLLATGIANGTDTRSLWSLPVFGGGGRKVREGVATAAASPDGRRVAFTDGSGSSLWVMNAEGSGARRVAAAGADAVLVGVQWLPVGERVAYGRVTLAANPRGGMNRDIRIECVDLADGKVHLLADEPDITAATIAAGRLIYAVQREQLRSESSLWAIPLSRDFNRPSASPVQIGPAAPGSWTQFSSSSDGTRIAAIRGVTQADVWIADLDQKPTHLSNVRRLTLNDSMDLPTAWTPDSRSILFVSERNGGSDIFRQNITEKAAEPLIAGPEDEHGPSTITPDGKWWLYGILPPNWRSTTVRPVTWMRVPVAGGPAEKLLDRPVIAYVTCARTPADLCVIGELKRGGIEFARVSVAKGREGVIGSLPLPQAEQASWDVSPDASTIAVVTPGELRFVPLTGAGPTLAVDRQTAIRGVHGLQGAAWSPDNRGIYTFSSNGRATTLLFISTTGTVEKLWETDGHADQPVPSPDGRHIAFANWTAAENVWVIDHL